MNTIALHELNIKGESWYAVHVTCQPLQVSKEKHINHLDVCWSNPTWQNSIDKHMTGWCQPPFRKKQVKKRGERKTFIFIIEIKSRRMKQPYAKRLDSVHKETLINSKYYGKEWLVRFSQVKLFTHMVGIGSILFTESDLNVNYCDAYLVVSKIKQRKQSHLCNLCMILQKETT